MKKFLLVLLFFVILIPVKSQVLITILLGDKLNSDGLEFGLEGGLNWSSLSGMDSKHYERNWNLGFYFDIRMKNPWYLYTGVLVKSSLGIDKLTDKDLSALNATLYYDFTEEENRLPGNYSQKMSYFLVPIMAKYKFKNHFYLEAGTQLGLMYQSWIEFNSDIDGRDMIMKEYNREDLNKIDAGLMGGIGYRMFKGTGWTIGVKYYQGLAHVYKGIKGNHNNSFFVKMNIPIGAGKKKEKDQNEE